MGHRLDQCIGQTLLSVAVVVFARALGQRLQRTLQRSSADLVEDAFDQDNAIVGRIQVEAARLNTLLLLVDDRLRICCMLGVETGVAETSHALFARVAQKPYFIKLLARLGRRPGDVHEVSETDLSHSQCTPALPEIVKLLADADSIGGSAAGQRACGLDPGCRAFKPLLV